MLLRTCVCLIYGIKIIFLKQLEKKIYPYLNRLKKNDQTYVFVLF